jgi:hypothetical protein
MGFLRNLPIGIRRNPSSTGAWRSDRSRVSGDLMRRSLVPSSWCREVADRSAELVVAKPCNFRCNPRLFDAREPSKLNAEGRRHEKQEAGAVGSTSSQWWLALAKFISITTGEFSSRLAAPSAPPPAVVHSGGGAVPTCQEEIHEFQH